MNLKKKSKNPKNRFHVFTSKVTAASNVSSEKTSDSVRFIRNTTVKLGHEEISSARDFQAVSSLSSPPSFLLLEASNVSVVPGRRRAERRCWDSRIDVSSQKTSLIHVGDKRPRSHARPRSHVSEKKRGREKKDFEEQIAD